ncbi:hypothetical protein GCM10010519_43190 [Streptomyces lactacystinicus]
MRQFTKPGTSASYARRLVICDTQFTVTFVIYDTLRMGSNRNMPRFVDAKQSNDHKQSHLLVKRQVRGVFLYQLCVGLSKFPGVMLTCYRGSLAGVAGVRTLA